MEPYRYHVFVCTQQKPEGAPSCPANNSQQVLDALGPAIQAAGVDDDVQVTTCGCMGLCEEGPVLIVYPDGVWYRRVKTEDVAEIVNSHLVRGKAVARLQWTEAAAMKAMSIEHRNQYRAMLKAKAEAAKA